MPDITGLNRTDSVTERVKIAGKWLYYFGSATHVNGIPVSYVYRTDLSGNLDLRWLPRELPPIKVWSAALQVLDSQGDVFVATSTNAVVRLAENDGRRVDTISVPLAVPAPLEQGQFQAKPELVGMALDGVWLYVAIRWVESTTDRRYVTRTRVIRLNVNASEFDPQWNHVLDCDARILSVASASVYLACETETAAALKRISTNAGSSQSWTRPYKAIAVDSQGRSYVIMTNPSSVRRVARLDATGEIDSSWSGAAVEASLPTYADVGFVQDRLVVLNTEIREIATYDLDGAMLGKRLIEKPAAGTRIETLTTDNKRAFFQSGTAVLSFTDTMLVQAESWLSPRAGAAGYLSQVIPLPAGGFALVGYFSFFLDGFEHRDFVLFDRNGRPATNVRMPARYESVRYVGTTDLGDLVLVATLPQSGEPLNLSPQVTRSALVLVNPQTGAARELTRLDLRMARSPDITAPLMVAAMGRYLYFADGGKSEIRRVSLDSGEFDQSWSVVSLVERVGGVVTELQTDTAGGLWVAASVVGAFAGTFRPIAYARFLSRDPTRPPEVIREEDVGGSVSQVFSNNAHAYIGDARFTLGDTLVRDPNWKSASFLNLVTDAYVYTAKYLDDSGGTRPARVTYSRLSINGNGRDVDPQWTRELPRDVALIGGALEIAGRFSVIGSYRPGSPWSGEQLPRHAEARFAAVFADIDAPSAESTVVEYKVNGDDRYFISGRPTEQAQLDSLPALFTRTGASFRLQQGLVIDGSVEPVCRFYAPQVGGKSSHFYGRSQDCHILNAVNGFAYEGYDFASAQPTNGVCPASAPVAIARMFNNKVATREGNHRYVANQVTKSQMLSVGWVDEGVVFCATSATSPR